MVVSGADRPEGGGGTGPPWAPIPGGPAGGSGSLGASGPAGMLGTLGKDGHRLEIQICLHWTNNGVQREAYKTGLFVPYSHF